MGFRVLGFGFRVVYRFGICIRWTPRPVIVIIMDNEDYIRVLLYMHGSRK